MKCPISHQIVKIYIICDIPTNICTKRMKNGDIIAQASYQSKNSHFKKNIIIVNNFPPKCKTWFKMAQYILYLLVLGYSIQKNDFFDPPFFSWWFHMELPQMECSLIR